MKPNQILNEDLKEIFVISEHNFKALMGKHLFITGGTGFFGKWIIESINFANEKFDLSIKVTTISRNPNAFFKEYPHFINMKNITFLEGDLSKGFPKLINCDYIIHAAADVKTSVAESEQESYLTTENAILKNVMEMAKNNTINRLLYISSGAVYRPTYTNESRPTELSPTSHKNSPYAQAKIKSEVNIQTFCNSEKIPFNIARCFAFIGAYLPLDGTYAAGNFFSDCLTTKEINIKGDGTPLRSYLYMTDLVHALLTLLIHNKENEIYNIGSSTTVSIFNLAKAISNEYPQTSVNIAQAVDEKKLISCYAPNIEKAQVELSWKPRVELQEAILRFKVWLSKN